MNSSDFDRRLRRALRPVDTTAGQRDRYQDLLRQQEVDDMAFIRRRSLTELGVIAALLVIVVASLAIWQRGDSNTDEPHAAMLAAATQTARASSPSLPTATESVPVQTDAAAGTCPVTLFNPNPPVRFRTVDAGRFPHWYGDEPDELWGAHGLDHGSVLQDADASNQWFVGRNQVVLWGNAGMNLTVTGRPLDGQDGTIEDVWRSPGLVGTQMTVLAIPAPGCWEIIAQDGDNELRIIINAQPFDERPDVVQARERHRLVNQEYPVPASCAVADWRGPDDRDLPGGFVSAPFWSDGERLSLLSPTGFFVAGENNLLGWWSEMEGLATLDMRSLDGGSASETLSTKLNEPGFSAQPLRFPAEGCWEVQATASGHAERFVVYVRPAEVLDLLEGA